MKIAWLDLETGGLNPNLDQIYEIGCIVDDLAAPEVPIEQLPQIQIYVKHPRLELDPYNFPALVNRMNAINMLGMEPTLAFDTFIQFLEDHANDEGRVTFGGKNVGSFDWQFIKHCPYWVSGGPPFKIAHRMLDIGSMCARPFDLVIPDLATCCKLYNIPVENAHEALPDAIMCAKVARAHYFQLAAMKVTADLLQPVL